MAVTLNSIQAQEITGTQTDLYLDQSYNNLSVIVVAFFSYNYSMLYNFGQRSLDFQHIVDPTLKLTVSGALVHNTGAIPEDLPYQSVSSQLVLENPDDVIQSIVARITPFIKEDFVYSVSSKTTYSVQLVFQFMDDYDKEIALQQISNIESELCQNKLL